MSISILIIEDNTTLINAMEGAITETFPGDDEIKIFPEKDNRSEFINSFSQKAIKGTDKLEKWVREELISYIDQNDIDLIVLDLYLYSDEYKKGLRADASSGYIILKQLRSSLINIPVFVNSIISQEMQGIDDDTFASMEGIIAKKGDKDDYIDYFRGNQFLIKKILRAAKFYKKEKIKSDIVVVCALKKEIKPVIDLMDTTEFIDNLSDTYAMGYIQGKNNKKLKIVAITKEQMGMTEAATLTTQVIEKYSPLFVIMTGIAAGVGGSQKMLDVLIPTHIYNWQSGKYIATIDDRKTELHEYERNFDSEDTYVKKVTSVETGSNINIANQYLNKIPEYFLESEDFPTNDYIERIKHEDAEKRTIYQKEIAELTDDEIGNNKHIEIYLDYISQIILKKRTEFQKELVKIIEEKKELENKIAHMKNENKHNDNLSELEKKLQDTDPAKILKRMSEEVDCNLIKEGMVSGNAVVADEKIMRETINGPKVSGVDMEAYGVAFACNNHPSKPNPIIIKAICDFADSNKNDVYQTAAAYASAQVLYKLFTECIDIG